MKALGIVICNYNKKDYCLRCIQSVLDSDFKDYDIFVVDNASSDGSSEAVRNRYGDRVTLLQNTENLGGSGGFNTGIRKVCSLGYPYLMCLDNDAQLDSHAITALYEFLEAHPEVGMAGSKVFHEGQPEYIQQYGLNINFQKFCAETLYCDQLDGSEIPPVVLCDTVAACSVMLPVKVVNEVGAMPEDNFIYWDDMEWGYRIKQAGYQVAAVGASIAYHEMGANVRKSSTFANYYLRRNSLHFFMKYTPKKNRDTMSFVLLRSVFDAIYESMYREEHNIGKTIMFALEDAIHHIRGKAKESRILPNDGNMDRFITWLRSQAKLYVEHAEDFPELIGYLKELHPNITIIPATEAASNDSSNASTPSDTAAALEESIPTLSFCNYIMDITDFSLQKIYVDKELNPLLNSEDALVIQNYSYSLQLFLYMHQPLFLDAIENAESN